MVSTSLAVNTWLSYSNNNLTKVAKKTGSESIIVCHNTKKIIKETGVAWTQYFFTIRTFTLETEDDYLSTRYMYTTFYNATLNCVIHTY